MPNRKRRNISIIAVLGLVAVFIGLYLQNQGNQISLQANQASIDYWIETNQNTRFYDQGYSMIWANSKNGGGMDGSFFLTITFVNATVATDQGYILTERTAKIPF